MHQWWNHTMNVFTPSGNDADQTIRRSIRYRPTKNLIREVLNVMRLCVTDIVADSDGRWNRPYRRRRLHGTGWRQRAGEVGINQWRQHARRGFFYLSLCCDSLMRPMYRYQYSCGHIVIGSVSLPNGVKRANECETVDAANALWRCVRWTDEVTTTVTCAAYKHSFRSSFGASTTETSPCNY